MFKSLIDWVRNKTVIGRLWKRYDNYVQLCLTSGYIPRVRSYLIYPSRLIFRLWLYIQLGKLRIVGQENLATAGRIIFCPNHSSLFDAVVVHSTAARPLRYMGAYESLKGLCGLKPILLTGIGCFAVDRAHGSTVLGAATKLLVSGEPLMIFPEGKIYNSGRFGEFKLGPALISRAAYEELGRKEPVGIVPMHICYTKRNVKTGDTFNFLKMGLSWRGGVTVFVGKPIWLNEHPGISAEDLMALVRRRMAEFTCLTSGESS